MRSERTAGKPFFGRFRRWLPAFLLCGLLFSGRACAEPAEDTFTEEDFAALSEEEQEAAVQQVLDSYRLTETGDSAAAAESLLVTEPELVLGYDAESGNYVYTLPDGSSFEMNVPEAAVSSKAVQLKLPAECTVLSVLRDGEPLYTATDTKRFTETGSYVLTLYKQKSILDESLLSEDDTDSGMEGIYSFQLHFQICDSVNNLLEVVNAPKDFEITAVSRNGKRSLLQEDTYFLPGDGSYSIECTSLKDSAIRYELRFTLDVTPPVLSFSKDLHGNVIKAPLEVSSGEACTVEVMHGTENYWLSQDSRQKISDTLENGGSYHLTATDAAGNSREYVFLLKGSSRIGGALLILGGFMLLGILAGTAYGKRFLIGFMH